MDLEILKIIQAGGFFANKIIRFFLGLRLVEGTILIGSLIFNWLSLIIFGPQHEKRALSMFELPRQNNSPWTMVWHGGHGVAWRVIMTLSKIMNKLIIIKLELIY